MRNIEAKQKIYDSQEAFKLERPSMLVHDMDEQGYLEARMLEEIDESLKAFTDFSKTPEERVQWTLDELADGMIFGMSLIQKQTMVEKDFPGRVFRFWIAYDTYINTISTGQRETIHSLSFEDKAYPPIKESYVQKGPKFIEWISTKLGLADSSMKDVLQPLHKSEVEDIYSNGTYIDTVDHISANDRKVMDLINYIKLEIVNLQEVSDVIDRKLKPNEGNIIRTVVKEIFHKNEYGDNVGFEQDLFAAQTAVIFYNIYKTALCLGADEDKFDEIIEIKKRATNDNRFRKDFFTADIPFDIGYHASRVFGKPWDDRWDALNKVPEAIKPMVKEFLEVRGLIPTVEFP